MFFFLSKVLSSLLNPSLWIGVLLILALVTKDQKKRKKRLIFTLIIFFFFSHQVLETEALRAWSSSEVPIDSIQHQEIGILLGGMVSYNRELKTPHFSQEADRFMQTLRLYRAGKISKILIAGGSGSLLHQDMREADYLKEFFVLSGVSEDDLLIERNSRNTHESAVNCKLILDSLNAKSVILITSALHMPRSIACFEKQEIEVQPFPANPPNGERDYRLKNFLIPSLSAFVSWYHIWHEMMGYFVYKVKGYA